MKKIQSKIGLRMPSTTDLYLASPTLVKPSVIDIISTPLYSPSLKDSSPLKTFEGGKKQTNINEKKSK